MKHVGGLSSAQQSLSHEKIKSIATKHSDDNFGLMLQSISEFKLAAAEMIALFLLSLSVSSLSGLPVTGDETCPALASFQKSLKDAVNQESSGESPLCEGSQPMSKNFIFQAMYRIHSLSFSFPADCTTAFLEIVKNCLDGVKVDAVCLKQVYQVCDKKDVQLQIKMEFSFRTYLGTRLAFVEASSSSLRC